tara:strand:- start:288 stop:500 length:213 start_codon:yes stop_codon:yes gene_type:complete
VFGYYPVLRNRRRKSPHFPNQMSNLPTKYNRLRGGNFFKNLINPSYWINANYLKPPSPLISKIMQSSMMG